GDITEEDHWFLMNVNNEMESGYDYQLNQVANLIKEVDQNEFEKPYVFNYQLLDYLLEKGDFNDKREILLKFLSNENDSSFQFVEAYVERDINVEKLVKYLCSFWKNIWIYIENKASLTTEQKERYYFLILNYAEIEDIEKVEDDSNMKS